MIYPDLAQMNPQWCTYQQTLDQQLCTCTYYPLEQGWSQKLSGNYINEIRGASSFTTLVANTWESDILIWIYTLSVLDAYNWLCIKSGKAKYICMNRILLLCLHYLEKSWSWFHYEILCIFTTDLIISVTYCKAFE